MRVGSREGGDRRRGVTDRGAGPLGKDLSAPSSLPSSSPPHSPACGLLHFVLLAAFFVRSIAIIVVVILELGQGSRSARLTVLRERARLLQEVSQGQIPRYIPNMVPRSIDLDTRRSVSRCAL